MGLRETMNNNPAAVTGGAVVVLILALVFVVIRGGFIGGGSAGSDIQYIYYDVANKQIKLVQQEGDTLLNSPLEGSTDVYEAALFACGECPENDIVDGMTLEQVKEKGMYIGWIHRRDPGTANDPEFEPSAQFRELKSGSKWVPGTSEAWYKLQEKIQTQCPGKAYATMCYPPAP